jgi:hypothetical protein
MATQHTFVVTSNSYVPTSDGSDTQVTIVGTVDGFPVTVSLWKSAYDQANAKGLSTLEALVAPIMYNAYLVANPPPPQPPVSQITGTFTYSL